MMSEKQWNELDAFRKDVEGDLPDAFKTKFTCGAKTYKEYVKRFKKLHGGSNE